MKIKWRLAYAVLLLLIVTVGKSYSFEINSQPPQTKDAEWGRFTELDGSTLLSVKYKDFEQFGTALGPWFLIDGIGYLVFSEVLGQNIYFNVIGKCFGGLAVLAPALAAKSVFDDQSSFGFGSYPFQSSKGMFLKNSKKNWASDLTGAVGTKGTSVGTSLLIDRFTADVSQYRSDNFVQLGGKILYSYSRDSIFDFKVGIGYQGINNNGELTAHYEGAMFYKPFSIDFFYEAGSNFNNHFSNGFGIGASYYLNNFEFRLGYSVLNSNEKNIGEPTASVKIWI